MTRLFVVRVCIVTLKRAIALSDRLKPETWETIATVSAVLFALFSWSLHESQRPRGVPGASTVAPQITSIPEVGAISIAGCRSCTSLYSHLAIIERTGNSHPHVSVQRDRTGSASTSTANPFLALAFFSQRDPRWVSFSWASFPETPIPERFFRRAPTVIYQVAQEEGTSFGKEIVLWVQVFGIIFTVLVAFIAQAMVLIGLHRKRAEGTLLRLEIEKRWLEIEQLQIALKEARNKSG